MNKYSDLFSKKPEQWGLRGDEYLWDHMQEVFTTKPLPKSHVTVKTTLEKQFLALTGKPISEAECFYLKTYAHGGMSSGGIDPEFWRDRGIPLLIENFEHISKQNRLPTEKALDRALDQAFKDDPDFVRWFLSKTKFSQENARYFWSRSNHPWGRIVVEVQNAVTGELELVGYEGETDVLVVFESEHGRRFAVHIENKMQSKCFTPKQADMYPWRAEAWKGNAAYKSYQDWDTVLIAPESFLKRNWEDSKKFGQVLTHKEIAQFVQAYDHS